MLSPTLRGIRRTANWLVVAFLLALGAAFIGMASGEDLLLAVPGIMWIMSPIVVAAGFVGASSTRIGALAFLAVEIAAIGSVAWAIIDFRYLHPSSTGAFALMVLPIFQAAGILIAFLIAMLFGWRMRPDFLKD